MDTGISCLSDAEYERRHRLVKEAMACSQPIVSVNVGDVKELLDSIEGCFIVQHDPKDISEAIKKAINFNKTNSRQKILDLSLDSDSISEKILRVYEEVLSSRPK